MNTVSATAKSVRISTRKVRLVGDAIRNMKATTALANLQLVRKHGAPVLIKTLKSAMANAVNNAKMAEDKLVITSLLINEGAFLKRFKASTRGRVHPYKKRSTHVTIVLKEEEK